MRLAVWQLYGSIVKTAKTDVERTGRGGAWRGTTVGHGLQEREEMEMDDEQNVAVQIVSGMGVVHPTFTMSSAVYSASRSCRGLLDWS